MGSDHERLQARADARLAKEAHRQERSTMNTTQAHGDAALGQAIEPTPKGRFGIRGFTMKAPPKREPFVPKPLVRRTVRVKPVDAVTEGLAPHRRTGPLPTRTPLAAAAAMHGIASDAPGQAITGERIVRPRGPEAIIRALRSKGITLALSADGRYVIPSADGGRMFRPERDLLDTTHDLIRAHLAGTTVVCQVGTHDKGTDATAVSVLVGGCPVCADHLAGGAS
jgi:hypothetical protein